jgi:hypothetical protein
MPDINWPLLSAHLADEIDGRVEPPPTIRMAPNHWPLAADASPRPAVSHEDLPAAVRAAFDEMVTAGGRDFTGRIPGLRPGTTVWASTRNGVSLNCLGNPDRGRAPHTDVCGGWINPLGGGARECACPCHDEHRPPYMEARIEVLRRVAVPQLCRAHQVTEYGADELVSRYLAQAGWPTEDGLYRWVRTQQTTATAARPLQESTRSRIITGLERFQQGPGTP